MEITLTTPALLFPTISMLLLAYTNRFLAIASVVRSLDASYRSQNPEADPHSQRLAQKYLAEIDELRGRIRLIRTMQFCGVFSLLLCTLCMFLLFIGWTQAGQWVFALSLGVMILSLIFSLLEIERSVDALDLHLADLHGPNPNSKAKSRN
jgi:hypothetical protein